MSYHLAQLIDDAKDNAKTTPEQRIQIVETILKLWMARRSLPGVHPGREFDTVFAALDRLADDSQWAFSNYRRIADELPDPESTELPLISTASELDRLVRQTVITLIAGAFERASKANTEWLDAAAAIQADLEGELSSLVTLIKRRLRRLQGLQEDELFTPDEQAVLDSSLGSPSAEDLENPMSPLNQARRLREMAQLLNNVADALDPQPTDASDDADAF